MISCMALGFKLLEIRQDWHPILVQLLLLLRVAAIMYMGQIMVVDNLLLLYSITKVSLMVTLQHIPVLPTGLCYRFFASSDSQE